MTISQFGPGNSLTPLAEARGTIRDALAAIRNFEHLLQSPRVGPRALAAVLPGIRDACAPIERAINDLVRRVGVAIDAGDEIAALSAFACGACARLSAALACSASIADAKTRLALEADIIRTRAELDAVRELVDLLQNAHDRKTEVDLDDLVHQALAVSRVRLPGARSSGLVTIAIDADGPFPASPRFFSPLLAVGIGLVVRAGVGQTCLHVGCAGGGPLVVRIGEDRVDGDVFALDPPTIIPPSLACFQTAVRESGGKLEVDDAGRRVAMTWAHE